MKNTKKAFSFVELIIVLAILALIWVVGFTMYNNTNEKTNNSKVVSWAKTLKNAFINYFQDNSKLPQPDWNNNYFKADSSYAHSGSQDAFWVYWSVTEKTLPKKYLDNLPLDPISNHYYSYWKTLDNKYFEVASIIRKSWLASTKLDWTYPWENWPISLIREYNWPYFVADKSQSHLPYNPDEHILVAKLFSHGDSIKVNWITVWSWSTKQVRQWDQIELWQNNFADLYFADGSVSVLWDDSKETKLTLSSLDYKKDENNLLTQVKLYLSVGSIFTQATALNQEDDWSDFEIYTQDTTAAVRWTEFLVTYDDTTKTQVAVVKWKVAVIETNNSETSLNSIEEDTTNIKIINEWQSISSETRTWCNFNSNWEKFWYLKNSDLFNQISNSNYSNIKNFFWIFNRNSEPNNDDRCTSISIQPFNPFQLLNTEIREIQSDNKPHLLDINIPKWKKKYILIENFDNSKKFKNNSDYLSGFIIKDWYLNATWSWNYLKYSGLNLWDNFVIEMRVRGAGLKNEYKKDKTLFAFSNWLNVNYYKINNSFSLSFGSGSNYSNISHDDISWW
jgi:type II secretory pathway pseudopilin PulG